MAKKKSNWKWISLNILIAVAILVGLVFAVRAWTMKYTDHGHEIEVPQVTGLYIQEAEFLLRNTHLQLEIVDSTYTNKVPLGTIVEQNPIALSHVKEGRVIYVVINSNNKRQIVLPELHDVSYRQAENMLRQLGVNVTDIVYEPSEYKDLVIDLRMGEESLETGAKIPEGSSLVMVVGQGRGSQMMNVPDVVGLPLADARSLLLSNHFSLGNIQYDDQPTEENKEAYVVYAQQPEVGTSMLEGGAVHIKLSLDREKVVTAENMDDDDDFF